ncbi:MAG TPA: MFS transporter [Dongiaceae bacterium]
MTKRSDFPQPTQRQRQMILAGLFASIFTFGTAFGGLVPWMALVLEGRGTGSLWIGAVAAANSLGVMLAAPFVTRLVGRFGTAPAMIASAIITLVATALLPVMTNVPAWFLLRLLSGLAGAVPWVVSETWINIVAGEQHRNRVFALYGALIAIGFATGPIILTLVGTEGLAAIGCFIALTIVSAIPMVMMWRHMPKLDHASDHNLLRVFRVVPALLAAAFLSGALDAALFSFLPIWGLATGLDKQFALTLLSIFIAGNILMQFPLGWVADKIGPRSVMLGCAATCLLGPVAVVLSLGQPVLQALAFFIWGGSVWGAYTVALAAMGRYFTGGALAVANAAFVMVYTFANIIGPPIAGYAFDTWRPHGLMVVSFAVALIFALIAPSPIRIKERDDC